MYKLHYDYFKRFYNGRLTLAYTDTDSFIYVIQTENIHEDFHERFKEIMDFCDYPRDHFLHDETNKKKIGFLKDEMNGGHII